MPRRWLPLLLCCTAALSLPFPAPEEVDSEESRRVLGSSVVTSVSVIMDLGNGTKKYFADAAGRPVPKPTAATSVGSPAGLMHPDRYEFYTFDEAGDLVKRLMSLDEIQSIIANGETELGEAGLPNYYHQNLPPDSAEPAPAASSTVTDKVVEEAEATDIGELSSAIPGVHDVVISVQNVLKGQLEASKNKISSPRPVPSPPSPTIVPSAGSYSSWNVILPEIVGNSGNTSGVASQPTYSTASPNVNTTKTLDYTTSVSTEAPSRVTESVTISTTQKLDSSSEVSSIKKPLPAVSSDMTDADQASKTHSKHPLLPSSQSQSHIPSSISSSSSVSPSQTPSSVTPTPLSSQTSSLLPLTTSHPSVTPASTPLQLPSLLASLSASPEVPLSPQSSLLQPTSTALPPSLTSKTTLSPAVTSTSETQSSSSYVSTLETLTNPPHILIVPSNVNEGKPLSSHDSYSKPTNGDAHISFYEKSATTKKPIRTTHLPSTTFKAPSSVAEPESTEAGPASSVTRLPVASSNEPSGKIPLNNEKLTSPLKVVYVPTTLPSSSSTVEETATSGTTGSSDTIASQFENSDPSEPTMVMISSSEFSNHDANSAAQEFVHFFTPSDNSSSTNNPTSTGLIHSTVTKTTRRPVTSTEHSKITESSPDISTPATTVVPSRPPKPSRKPQPTTNPVSTHSRNPIKPLRTTPTAIVITKTTTEPPRSSSSSVQTSTTNPTETTKLSSIIIKDKNEYLSTIELLKTTSPSSKSTTTTQSPLPSTTQNSDVDNLLINEASGYVPIKFKPSLGVEPLPATSNGNLDMPPELAESVLGVLSQVADVEGAATTIDYGESGLYIFSSSVSTTRLSNNTEAISSTESGNPSSPTSTAKYSSFQTSTAPLHIKNVITTDTINISHSTPVSERLPAANQQNEVTTESLREIQTSQPLSNLKVHETTGDQTTGLYSIEYTSNIYEQGTTVPSTIETTLSGVEHNKNDSEEVKKTEEKEDEKGDGKEAEDTNKNIGEISSEDQKKVNKETITDTILDSTDEELFPSASNNNEALKTSLELPKNNSSHDEIITTILDETGTDYASKLLITTESVEVPTTGNDQTEQRETTTASVTELTTDQQSTDTQGNTIKNEVKVTSASKLDVEETSTAVADTTETEEQDVSTPESIVSKDTTESPAHTTKDSTETSTATLTKYKKDDIELAEESMQGKLAVKIDDESTSDKTSTVKIYSAQDNETSDDIQRVATESQEYTTQSEYETTEVSKTEDKTQKEELESEININTSTTKAEFVQSTDTNIADKNGIVNSSEVKTDKYLEPATELPAEHTNEDAIGFKTSSFENIDAIKPDIIAEEITTEVTSRYETEITTVENRFSSESDDNASLLDGELVVTTYASLTDDEGSEATTQPTPVQGNETVIENDKTSLEKESGVNLGNINYLDSDVTSSIGALEKGTAVRESDVSKPTAGGTSWTKIPAATPQVKDEIAVSSTRRPVTVSSISPTTDDATTPVETLKASGLNDEKVKDTKIKANPQYPQRPQTYTTVDLEPAPQENLGLEATSAGLSEDVQRFAELCNELAFRLWSSVTSKGLTTSRSVIMSPFAVTSLLAMVFLGARGPTSGQMNDILRLDDMVTFNPHQVFRNVTESVAQSKTQGVASAAFVRELYSDRLKGKLLDFYKERAQQFYDGHVEEVNFNAIGDLVRRRTNMLMKRQTRGRVPEYLRGSNIQLRPPLAVFSANIFQTDCSQASTYGRDGEMYFTVIPALRQRRLVPVPAVVWFSGFLAGYEPVLDATAVSIGKDDSIVSLVMVLPGQQGQQAPGDGLQRLEQRLIESSYRRGAWSRLLRSLLPRPGLELQIPRFSHRSLLNVTSPLQRMGLKDLFSAEHADLRGINGLANDLHLSDIVQVNTFSTCAEESIGSRHHVEVYPTSPQRSGREELEEDPKKGSMQFDDMEDLGLSSLPLALRPRQARLPDAPRLRFDRPFLYFVRHNPTGLILHMGRFNPRLLH